MLGAVRTLCKGAAKREQASRTVALQMRGIAATRFMSGSPNLVIEKNATTKIATLRMANGPVNSLGRPFIEELTAALKELESDTSVNGLILTSGCKKVFSAGLDLQEIIKPEPENVRAFWFAMQELWLTLYGSPLATVAAVNGAAPAAGCLLAMSCDYRVMAPDYVIGLNETRFGLVAPTWFVDLTVNTIGHRQAEKLLFPGTLIMSQEALKVGMVDEVVPLENVEATALERCAAAFKGVDMQARHETKCSIRGAAMDRLRTNREADLQWFVDFAMNPVTQNHLSRYMEALKAKPKK
mmetsp:Transcript_23280/g.37446  ORF Transcript_23280/g.37446 Transcript_23280/m.37446 type:complete len:297 (-) Transcript_23280:887-1777(-)